MSTVSNENLDELSSIEKLSDEDLFKAFLTEGSAVPASDMMSSYNDSESFNSTPEGYPQSSSDEIADTPPHDTSPYTVDSNRDIRLPNNDIPIYANYERLTTPRPTPSRIPPARFTQRQYPTNQVPEHTQVLYPASFGSSQLPIAHRPTDATIYRPPQAQVQRSTPQSYVPAQGPQYRAQALPHTAQVPIRPHAQPQLAPQFYPAPYPAADPQTQVEAQLEHVLNDRIKQQQQQALQQAQMLFSAPVSPAPRPVQFKPLTDEAYLPLPPLAPNNRKRQREGEDEARKDEGEDDEDRLVKRQKRLIKNRESAQLSRIRKKQHVDELERAVSGLQEASTQLEWRIEELQLENTVLRDDNSYLRELISTQPSYAEHMRARDSARQHEYQQQRARLQEQQRARAASTTAHRQQQAASMRAANVCLLIIIFAFGLFINSPDATSTILGPKNIVFVRDNSARSLTGLEAAQSVSTPQFDASYGHEDRGDEEHNTSTALFCPAARRVLVNTGRGSEVATSALSFVLKLDEFKRGEDEIMVTRATDPSQPYVHVQCSAYILSSVSMIDLDGESRDAVKTVGVDTRPREHVAQAA